MGKSQVFLLYLALRWRLKGMFVTRNAYTGILPELPAAFFFFIFARRFVGIVFAEFSL